MTTTTTISTATITTRLFRWALTIPLLAFGLLATVVANVAPVAPVGVAQAGTTSSVNGADSLSYTVPAGTNRLLLVTVSHADDSGQSYTGVTFGASGLTAGVSKNDGFTAVDSIWYLPMGTSASPTTAIIATARPAGAGTRPTTFLSAQTFINVDQSTPLSSPQSTSNPEGANISSTLTVTSAVGDLVMDIFDMFASAAATANSGASQTQIGTSGVLTLPGVFTTYPGSALYKTTTKAGAASVATSWTSNATATIHIATNIKQAAATPAPTVSAISPANGSTAGGSSVTITGTNLTGATAVTIGGTAATAVSVTNASTITATTPAHAAGLVSVAVTTPGGTGTGANLYTYTVPNAAPTDIALSNAIIPENNAAGATIGTLTATDADSGDTHTFTLAAGGADNAAFTITGGTLTINAAADFETKSSYAIRIRATDNGTGNLTFEKAFTVTITMVDATAPETTITSAPASLVNSRAATIAFSGTDNVGVTGFEASLDGASYSAATSPASFTGLGDGLHTFSVRAVDAAGNVDATPASVTWTVDATAPETTITSAPAGTTTSTTAEITFTGTDGVLLPGVANDAGPSGSGVASFETSLDGAPFSAATSPVNLSGLSVNEHTFRVRAVDVAGNVDATPASATWTVAAAMTVSANGTYTIQAGDPLVLTASGTPSVVGDTISYSWTINGVANAAVGANPTVTWAQLQALGVTGAVASVAVSVTGKEYAASASGVPAYYPTGTQLNVPIATILAGGWTLGYSDLYANNMVTDTVLTSATGGYLMLAARAVGSDTILLLGAAPRGDVTFDTEHTNTTHVANGVGWYFSSNWSWGFAEGNDAVIRSEADVNDSPNADRRLSWHTGIGAGGYRIGALTGLNGSTAYERLVFQSDGGVVVATASDATTLAVTAGGSIAVDLNGPRTSGTGAAVDFGTIAVNGSSAYTLIVANHGTAPLTIRDITVPTAYRIAVGVGSGSGAPTLFPLTIAAGADKFFDVFFEPVESGTYTGNLSIVSNDPDTVPFLVPVTGRTPQPLITVVHNTEVVLDEGLDQGPVYDFGDVRVGSTSTHTFTIFNHGSAALNVSSINIYENNFEEALSGVAAVVDVSDYEISGVTLPAAIPVDGSLTFDVVFQPQSTGRKDWYVDIESDASNHSTFLFPVTGYGVTLTQAEADAVTVTTGYTRIYPLANDTGAPTNTRITSVSGASGILISADGRSLLIPSDVSGVFTYTTNIGTTAQIVVTGHQPSPRLQWVGLLYNAEGGVAGWMQTNSSPTGRCSVQIKMGSNTSRGLFNLIGTKTDIPVVMTPPVGQVTATQDSDGHLLITIHAGSTLTGDLRPTVSSATPRQYNIALASTDSASIPGGGVLRAIVKSAGGVNYIGNLPDGTALWGRSQLLDNDTFLIYNPLRRLSPRGILTGGFTLANLPTTDITGELRWTKPTQAGGLNAAGFDTFLTGNGCIYAPGMSLVSGPVELDITGGNLPTELLSTTTATGGRPTLTPLIRTWNVDTTRGTFRSSLYTPIRSSRISCSGIYLPKSHSAWGYFKGNTLGGRLDMHPIER